MNFWNMLKYALMVLFLAIVVIAAMNSGDEKASNEPNATQQPQTKFNL